MKILFVGGTGIISTACTKLAVARGWEVTLLNRARRGSLEGTRSIQVDVSDAAAAARALQGQSWDAIVDFIVFTPVELESRIALFKGKSGQYVFISSASAYQKPLTHYLVDESTPLFNPYWEYSRNKITCEERLNAAYRNEGLPMTIVRPSLTYGDTIIPLAVNSWLKSYTAVERMRKGLPVIVPGDGLTLWTMTHNTDFAKGLLGLLGHPGAVGHAFNITSDEALTWDQIYRLTAEAAGVPEPKLVHIASDFITACLPDSLGSLTGDKSNTALFDTSKLRRFVPDFVATTRYRDGIRRSIAWYDADLSRRQIDTEANASWERLIAAYEKGLKAATAEFAPGHQRQ